MKKTISLANTLAISLFITSLATAQEWEVSRTADGKPNLQGIWTNATQTPLQRSREFGDKGALTEEEASNVEAGWRNRIASASAPSDPERAPPTDGNTDLGYNNFWVDRGTNVIQLEGQYRTSIIVDPADGRIPYVEDFQRNSQVAKWRSQPGVNAYDGHELRPLAERCLLSFGSSSGPPMLPVMYNNNYQIVQTPDHVMILVEMVHDARIIRIDQEHYEQDFQRWLGDSIGYWEDDTLIVKTKRFHDQQSYRGTSAELVVTERFEMVEENKIKYSFTMEDPQSFRQPWTGEIAMNRRPDGEPMYEYACHEGNYAFSGIMGGARRLESDQASSL